MVKRLNILATLGLLFFGMVSSYAQVRFRASSERDEVGRGEQFRVEFVVNAGGENFKAPDFGDFQVVKGPMRSQQTQIVNFEMTQSLSFTYLLRAKKTGVHTIGAASIKVKGRTYKTKPLRVKVLAKNPRANDPNDPYTIAARSAFVKVIPSKSSVYQGEPFIGSYKLYFNTAIGQPRIQSEPDFTGFYQSNIEVKPRSAKLETYKGSRYKTAVIGQVMLIPQRSGTLRPGEVEVNLPTSVPIRQRDRYGRVVTYNQTVNQVSHAAFPAIKVKPLPEKTKPSDFSGAVGQYKFDVSLSRSEVPASESVTLKISISGSGNIKLIDVPEPELPTAFEAYDPEVKEKIRINGAGMSGSKTYEYLLIPRYGGTYKIPPISFSYFDPSKGRYQKASSKEMEIVVTGGTAQPDSEGFVAGGETETVGFIGKDILFIKTDPGSFSQKGESFLESTAFYTLSGFGGVSLAGMLAYFFLVSNRQRDHRKERSQKASKIARRHLSQAKKELDNSDSEAFYQALTSALWGYFSDKFSIPNSQLSKEIILEKLQESNIDEAISSQLMTIMNRAEMARFTSAADFNLSRDYEETAQLITQIDTAL